MRSLWDTSKTSRASAFGVKLNGMKSHKSLSYKEHIEKVLKKANSRVKLLSQIRQDLAPHAAQTMYKVMILPLLVYCNNIFIDMSPHKKQQFEKIQMRCLKIINCKRNSVKKPSINHIRNKCVQLKFSHV